MKKTMAFLLAAALWAGTARSAPADSKLGISLGGGLAFPLNSGLTENYNTAFHLGATLDIAVQPNLSIFVDGRLHALSIKSGAYDFPDTATLTGGGAKIFSIIGGAKYTFPSQGSVHVYVLAGAGINSQSYADVTGQWTIVRPGYTQTSSQTESLSSSTGLGILVGPGLLVDLGPSFALFGELRYASSIGKNMYLPIVVGVRIKP
jgi:hypothetical protein